MKNKIRLWYLVILFFISTHSVFSQIYFSNMVYNRNSAYVEVMGSGKYWTANYEYLIKDFGIKQAIRAGAGVFPNIFNLNKPLCFTGTVEYNAFWLSKYHHIECGVGFSYRREKYTLDIPEKTYTIVPPSDTVPVILNNKFSSTLSGPFITGRIGYRYQDPDGGLILRAGWTPLFFLLNREKTTFNENIVKNSILPFSTRIMYFGFSIGWNWY